ncbi:hypothetical protein FD755_005797, partial [Muntiacus reevesi]
GAGFIHNWVCICVPAQVVAAVDVNTVANEVYKYNFPHTRLLAKTIESSPTTQFKSINFLALHFLHSPTLTSIHDHWKNHSLD